MSTGNKRTIRQIYTGTDLSDVVLNLPLTPYSEQFLPYKQKLDKALSDLKLLVQSQLDKEEEKLDLGVILERIRNTWSSGDDSSVQKGVISDQIKQDKYFGVYLEIIQLEESKSDILECFIKWKNDYYYTRWEEFSQPPNEMRDHWLRFKDKISKIILDSRKISSRPLPRLLVSENKSLQEDSRLNNDLVSMQNETISVEDRQDIGQLEEGDVGNVVQNNLDKEAERGQSEENKGQEIPVEEAEKVNEERRKGRKRQQREKGSSELWGPKAVPKSKNRYISGISAVRAVRKRTYSSNGRVRLNRDKRFGSENVVEGDEKENVTENTGEQTRNLKKWERLEEKRYEAKFNKYLLKNKNSNEKRGMESLKVEESDILRDLKKWSNNFSQGCKDTLLTKNRFKMEDSELVRPSLELSKKIKEEVDSLINLTDNYMENDGDCGKNFQLLEQLCKQFLRENFGYDDFRQGQLEAIYSILLGATEDESFRKGSILILPTGYGKSLCFQYLSLLMNMWFGKVTLVITPLISLMQDQLRNLSKRIRGAVWNSSVSVEEKRYIVKLIEEGSLDILFVTPESMFSTFLTRGVVVTNQDEDKRRMARLDLSKNRIALLCVDEAHCVCEWGHSFRPNYYSCIGHLINNFKVERILGITATAPSGMLEELKSLLKVGKVIQPYSNQKIQRENLHCKVLHLDLLKKKALQDFNRGLGLSITKVPKVYNNYSLIWDHIKYSLNSNHVNNNQSIDTKGEPKLHEKKKTRREVWSKCRNILIYVWQRSEVEAVTNYLRTKGANALYYHGMMSNTEREMVQKSFIDNKTNIFVATTSFGMGIDKKDIDAVIHWNMPNSLEQYIQETGRCARQLDKLGICLMILSDDDYRNKRQIISASLMDKTALRCLLHVILGRYRFGNDSDVDCDFEKKRIELEIFPMELFKIVLNVKQVEEIEALLHHLKPYMDYLLRLKYKGRNISTNWVSYIRGSPYLKIRCFDEDFSKIKEKSDVLSSLSRFSTENSGVVTINLLEASMSLGKSLEELEDEIENEKGIWKISVERLTNKQCVILGQSLIKEESQCFVEMEGSISKKDFRFLFLEAESEESGVVVDTNKLEIIKENWLDLLVEDLYRELLCRNSDELWKLDIAYFSFQKFGMDRACKDSIIESYFGNKRSELYHKLFNQEIDEYQNTELSQKEGLEGISSGFIRDLVQGKANNSFGNNTFEMMIQEIWINKWNQDLLQDLALGRKELVQLDSLVGVQDGNCRVERNRESIESVRQKRSNPSDLQVEDNNNNSIFNNNINDNNNININNINHINDSSTRISERRETREKYQKISSCIKSGLNSLLSNYLNDLSPVQWETYRISTERIFSHFSSKFQKDSKRRRRDDMEQRGGSGLDFGHYLGFEEFDVIFPADIARILVGVTSFRYSYKAKGGLKKDYLDSNDVVSSKLWGKFKSIPYSVVLEICQEGFKEIIKSKLSV
ncbi:4 SF II RNA helicase [Cryptosporidium sp. chipmunk genotype I]|uniref:4 SF II RNA helicase n=1 Tax=Cryptosporidium sp. chipmunk genotype I TaxID=1280935 RepID=UPI00351A3561|nr:4 SF II RNA helicase [Cryptosporidium sp. chipmunk genotype I]